MRREEVEDLSVSVWRTEEQEEEEEEKMKKKKKKRGLEDVTGKKNEEES